MDHVWRVFENGKERLFKNLNITVPIKSEKDANGVDYNIVCAGELFIDRETSTAHIGTPAKHDAVTETKQAGLPSEVNWPVAP